MRKSLLPLALCAFLFACNPTTDTDTNPETGTGTVLTEGAAQGEFCGGIAAIECATGLNCIYEGTYPDAGGTCQ